jgi:lysozyme family protein
MDAAYNDALAFVLRWEGGFVDDPQDHGGRTMKGVTQNVYNAWRASQGKPPADVKNIANDELAAIYQNNYWRKALCNVLQSNIDLVQFDTGVNMGPVRAIKMLQQAVGVGVDGNFGQETQKACDPRGALSPFRASSGSGPVSRRVDEPPQRAAWASRSAGFRQARR